MDKNSLNLSIDVIISELDKQLDMVIPEPIQQGEFTVMDYWAHHKDVTKSACQKRLAIACG